MTASRPAGVPVLACSLMLLTLLTLLTLLALPGCKDSDSSGPLPPGVVPVGLPDSRVFILDGTSGEVRVLDGNFPGAGGLSAPLDLGGAGAGGVALDPHGNRLWITLRNLGQVRVVDARTLEHAATLAVGSLPGAIAIDGAAGRVYIANEGDGTVSVLDADLPFPPHIGSPVAVGNAPVDLVVVAGTVVAANRDDGTISAFNAASPFAALGGSPFVVGTAPIDLEGDPGDGLVFVANRDSDSVSVFDVGAATVTTPLTGVLSPVAIARHVQRDLIFIASAGAASMRIFSSAAAPAEDGSSGLFLGEVPGGLAVNGFLDQVTLSFPASGTLRVYSGAAPFAELDPARRPAAGSAPGKLISIEPTSLRTLAAPGGAPVQRTRLVEGRLYIAHGSAGLVILDPADPRADFAASHLGTLAVPGNAVDVAVRGDWAFISNEGAGVQVADVIDPAFGVIEQTVGGIGTADEVFVMGSFVIADTGSAGVRVIDARIPQLSFLLATANPGGSATGFDLHTGSRFAHSASGGTSLHIVDVSDPLAPFTVETVPVPVTATDVAAISGAEVAVAVGVAGVRTVRINPVTGSQLAGHLDLGVTTTKIQSIGELLFVTDSANAIHVVAAGDLDAPRWIGSLAPAGAPTDVRAAGNLLYISEGTTGLEVVRFFP